MIPVRIHSLGLDQTSDQPVILLKEEEGLRILPIWIGHPEATAILIAIEGIVPPRPMTHDLILSALTAGGLVLERVEITRLEEGTFFAALILRGEERTIAVDARPSDSIALAVRAGCPLLVAEEVLDEAGIVPDDEAEEEVERFRDFLDTVDPEDFAHS
jgi:bifunctional DNase/RNase